jgi:predicted MPP superfamily phosphohydrolase
MILLTILILSELLTFFVFRQHYYGSSKAKYYLSLVINSILSIYLWILYIKVAAYSNLFDEPDHVWLMMNLTGTLCAVLMPRVILDVLHFSGKLIKTGKGGHIRSLTNTGIVVWIIVFSVVIIGTIKGRFNIKTDEITIKVKGLNEDLNGLKIVQLSDLHLSSFLRHKYVLKGIMEKANSYKPDILINSGDFVNYGWREYDRNDTILSLARGRFGNFAVLGNHDIGTYYPGYNEADCDTNIIRMVELITASGYRVLNDENTTINIGKARVAVLGVITKGKHRHMIHGDLKKAMNGLDSADFRILISHDPNQWEKDVKGKTAIELTLSGHTHGMQMGIMTKRFKWSPSEYFYPRWNGLYKEGNQYLYVSRGLGVVAIPFRIWMPPEISVIKLVAE